MNLRNLSDQVLLMNTEKLAREERELLTKVLHHLREIERRRLFSELGFKSLFEYSVKKLGYSEDQAGRRISAMRLLKEIPELETKIESSALTLTNLGLAQSLFRAERKTADIPKEKKLEIISKLENKSKREAEKIILNQASDPHQLIADRVRAVTSDKIEIKMLADLGLEKMDPMKKFSKDEGERRVANEGKTGKDKVSDGGIENTIEMAENSPAPAKKMRVISAKGDKKRSYISVHLRRAVWKRANGRCENCESEYALEIDHLVPVGKGGVDEISNLRLLCRSCNQRSAINEFGVEKMGRYLP